MTTFVDTNVLVYLLKEDEEFHDWAKKAIEERKNHGPLIICDIVYSEFSVSMESVDKTNEAVAELALERLRFSNEALFYAGKAFKEHKRRGGTRSNVLADFLIGAQAELEDAPLITNNAKDYTSYFPKVSLIQPPKGG
jgi:predicted nucleic acid-binding protein